MFISDLSLQKIQGSEHCNSYEFHQGALDSKGIQHGAIAWCDVMLDYNQRISIGTITTRSLLAAS